MPFEITALGTSAAVPELGRHTACYFFQYRSHRFLIDCGESAQINLKRYTKGSGRLNAIFISHAHGDHFFGLPGLLFSLSLNNDCLKVLKSV